MVDLFLRETDFSFNFLRFCVYLAIYFLGASTSNLQMSHTYIYLISGSKGIIETGAQHIIRALLSLLCNVKTSSLMLRYLYKNVNEPVLVLA